MAKSKYLNLRWRVAQWLEIRWWRQYLKRKPPAPYLQQKAAYWRRMAAEAGIAVPTGAQVLDAGCGPAGIFMILEHAAVTAVDPLLEQYRHLPHFEASNYPSVAFRQMALEDLQERSRYDVIFCLNVINHVADLPRALHKLALALKVNGTCWVSVDAHHFSALQPIFAALPGDALHPHQHTRPQYEGLLREAGFCIQRRRLLKPGGLFDYWIFQLKRS